MKINCKKLHAGLSAGLLLALLPTSLWAQPVSVPSLPPSAQPALLRQDLTRQATAALQLWREQNFVQLRQYLSPSLQTLLPVPELQRFWQAQVKDIGAIQTVGQPRLVATGTTKLILFPVEFAKTKGNVVVSFNESNQIAGINFPTLQTIEQIAEKSVLAMAQGDLVTARDYFRPALKAEISPQQLQQKWQQLQNQAGAFQQIKQSKLLRASSAGDPDLVMVTIQFAKITDDLIIVFDQNKEIVSVDFPSP